MIYKSSDSIIDLHENFDYKVDTECIKDYNGPSMKKIKFYRRSLDGCLFFIAIISIILGSLSILYTSYQYKNIDYIRITISPIMIELGLTIFLIVSVFSFRDSIIRMIHRYLDNKLSIEQDKQKREDAIKREKEEKLKTEKRRESKIKETEIKNFMFDSKLLMFMMQT